MRDTELLQWWPDLGVLVRELRRIGRADLADKLVAAVQAGAFSDEILGNIGLILRDQFALRSQLDDAATNAWDAILTDIYQAFPGSRLSHWSARLKLFFSRLSIRTGEQ